MAGENKAVFKGHNMAIELDRAAGSTMKPIFDYAPAIEYLKWATYHQIDDSPFKYSTGQEVRNSDRSHMVHYNACSIRKVTKYPSN